MASSSCSSSETASRVGMLRTCRPGGLHLAAPSARLCRTPSPQAKTIFSPICGCLDFCLKYLSQVLGNVGDRVCGFLEDFFDLGSSEISAGLSQLSKGPNIRPFFRSL